MSENFLLIIAKAIKIQMDRGISFEDIIATYSKLDENDIAWLKERFNIKEA